MLSTPRQQDGWAEMQRWVSILRLPKEVNTFEGGVQNCTTYNEWVMALVLLVVRTSDLHDLYFKENVCYYMTCLLMYRFWTKTEHAARTYKPALATILLVQPFPYIPPRQVIGRHRETSSLPSCNISKRPFFNKTQEIGIQNTFTTGTDQVPILMPMKIN